MHHRLFRSRLVALLFVAAFGLRLNGATTEVQFLSGHGKDDAVPWKFFCTSGANSGVWTNIPVPSQWDVRGFGTLSYKKDQTNAWNERGLYEHDFSVADNWRGKRIFLVFEGVMTDTDAKLNAQSVGPVHQGSFYRFKYEVTSLVKFGARNKLEVTVSRHSANESVNKAERLADYWVFAGIFRPVYLEAVPPQFIERVAIDAKADGSFSANVFVKGMPDLNKFEVNAESFVIEAQIYTDAGTQIGSTFSCGTLFETNLLKSKVSAPKLWTAETPNLYNAIFRLKQNGKVVHEISQRFGFRTVEVRAGDGIYVNGSKVILKGANRHSFWPDSGRCLSEAVHRLDIQTLKDANMNAVRMSHYPPDAQFLDLCDELGLYVLNELAGWHNHYDNEVGPKLVREMVTRDVNHPSILFWDNGNEGGFNTNLDQLYREHDPQQRPVLHPWAIFSGVNTAHYLGYENAQQAARGEPMIYHDKFKREMVDTNRLAGLIYLPTEFLHGLYDGGAGAGLEDYWSMMMSRTNCAGGFIWALLDEGVKRPDTGMIDVAGNQAPDGIVGPYREREGSFYAIKELWSPIQITRDETGKFEVENRYSFTDTSACRFEWELRRFAAPTAARDQTHTVLASGTAPAPKIAPRSRGAWKLSLPPTKNADALALRVLDPTGRELWTWVWPLRSPDTHRLAAEPAFHHAEPIATNELIRVTAGELTVEFSRETGRLLTVRRGAQNFSLNNGPRLAVGQAKLREIRFTDDGPDAVVSAKYDGDLKSVLWRIHGNGWVQCSYAYHARGTNDFFGVLFDYPETLVTDKRWLGDGPFRVWQNRLVGVTAGVWANDYNDTLTGWSGWVYPEFKGFFSNWRWLQLGTREGPITVINHGDTKFLQVLTPKFLGPELRALAFAPVPEAGLGFLDAIPPVGSKFKAAKFGGPQGQRAVLNSTLTGSVNFYFGKLP